MKVGRKRRDDMASKVQTNMVTAGLYGSQIIRDYLRGQDSNRKKFTQKVSNTKLQAAIKAVEHTIGLPKAKLDIKTDALTMADIARLAAAFDAGGEDVMEVPTTPTKPLTARQIKERASN